MKNIIVWITIVSLALSALLVVASSANEDGDNFSQLSSTSSRRVLATKYPTRKKTAYPTKKTTSSPTTRAPTPSGNTDNDFNIEIVFVDTVNEDYKQAILNAKNKWESVIKTGIPNTYTFPKGTTCFADWATLPNDKVVDDLLIFVKIGKMDGPGNMSGRSGLCVQTRTPDAHWRVGMIQMDAEDLNLLGGTDYIEKVAKHQIGHMIGIGTLWKDFNLIKEVQGKKPTYTGAGGIEGQSKIGGSGQPILEINSNGGMEANHWSESVYDTELMTTQLDANNYLSKLSVLSLKDLGFEVNESNADAYTIPSALRGASEREGPKVDMSNDIIQGPYIIGEVDPY